MIRQRSFLSYFLLSLITFGIYSIYFWYVFSEDMNEIGYKDNEKTTNYLLAVLFSFLTFGIYMFWWHYKLGNRIQNNAPRYGLSFPEGGKTILLFMIFGFLLLGAGIWIAEYILISNMNTLAQGYNLTYSSNRQH